MWLCSLTFVPQLLEIENSIEFNIYKFWKIIYSGIGHIGAHFVSLLSEKAVETVPELFFFMGESISSGAWYHFQQTFST